MNKWMNQLKIIFSSFIFVAVNIYMQELSEINTKTDWKVLGTFQQITYLSMVAPITL